MHRDFPDSTSRWPITLVHSANLQQWRPLLERRDALEGPEGRDRSNAVNRQATGPIGPRHSEPAPDGEQRERGGDKDELTGLDTEIGEQERKAYVTLGDLHAVIERPTRLTPAFALVNGHKFAECLLSVRWRLKLVISRYISHLVRRKPEQPAQRLDWQELFCPKQLAEKHNYKTHRRRPKRPQETVPLDLAQICGLQYLVGDFFFGVAGFYGR